MRDPSVTGAPRVTGLVWDKSKRAHFWWDMRGVSIVRIHHISHLTRYLDVRTKMWLFCGSLHHVLLLRVPAYDSVRILEMLPSGLGAISHAKGDWLAVVRLKQLPRVLLLLCLAGSSAAQLYEYYMNQLYICFRVVCVDRAGS